jgi:hypothetical protein
MISKLLLPTHINHHLNAINNMKARLPVAPLAFAAILFQRHFVNGTIGYVLLALSTPSILNAQTKDYGTTRQPQTCPSRSQPTNGPITARTAKKYLTCLKEEFKCIDSCISFFDVNSLQMAPKSRQATGAEINFFSSRGRNIDTDKPIYDFKVNATQYLCYAVRNNPSSPILDNRGKNCTIIHTPNGYGKCFQNTFGEWYCTITQGTGTADKEKVAPPANINSNLN